MPLPPGRLVRGPPTRTRSTGGATPTRRISGSPALTGTDEPPCRTARPAASNELNSGAADTRARPGGKPKDALLVHAMFPRTCRAGAVSGAADSASPSPIPGRRSLLFMVLRCFRLRILRPCLVRLPSGRGDCAPHSAVTPPLSWSAAPVSHVSHARGGAGPEGVVVEEAATRANDSFLKLSFTVLGGT